MPIEKIKAREIFNSQGEPTLEVDVITDIGVIRSSVSSYKRDDNDDQAEQSPIIKAVNDINTVIAPELLRSRLEVCQQREIDSLLTKLNDISVESSIGVSMACCKAGAIKKGIPLYRYISLLSDSTDTIIPVPVFNVICGGKLAGNSLTCQEFSIIPTGAKSFKEGMTMGIQVFRAIEKIISESEELKLPLTVGNDGSFLPEFEENTEALSTIVDAIKLSGYDEKVKVAIDMAASTFCKDGQYDLEFKTEDTDPDDYLESEALKDQYLELLAEFPQLISIEDPFDQDDWDGWSLLANQQIQIVADDLTAMNMEKIEEAVEKGAANCLVIRLSQIGTITEAIDCFKLARSNGWSSIVCADYNETEDNFVADLAVGLSAGQFKVGAPCRGERTMKYNQILRIEEELGKKAKYAGEMFRNPQKLSQNSVDDEGQMGEKKKKKKKSAE